MHRIVLSRLALVLMLSIAASLGAQAQTTGQPSTSSAVLPPVAVTAARVPQPLSELLADVTVIGPEELARAGQSSLAQLLARQPGVEYASTGGPGSTTSIFLRGGNTGHTIVLIDGVRVGSSSSGTTPFEAIPVSQIDHIEILRGPASSLYGADAVSGVIQIFTKRGVQAAPSFSASAGYGSYDTSKEAAGVFGGTGNWDYALSVGAEHSRGFQAIFNPSNFSYNQDRAGYGDTNASGHLSYRFNDDHALSADIFHSRLNAQFANGLLDSGRTITTLDMYKIASRDRLVPSWVSNLSLGDGVDDSASASSFGPSVFRTRQLQLVWQNDLATPVGNLQVFAERREERLSSDTPFPVTARDTNAAGVIFNNTYGNHLLQANARYDHSSQFGGRPTGAIAYGYRFTPEWRASVSAGTAFKAPTFNDLYFPDFSNPNLQPEKSRNVEAGIYYSADGRRARLVAYRNRVSDLIVFECDSSFVCAPQNVADALLEGITMAYEQTWRATTLGASLDLQRPEDRASGNLLPRRARRHGVIGVRQDFGAWRAGVEVSASSVRFEDAANTRRMGGYALTNLTFDYTLNKSWSVLARADNIFNKRYELAADYNTAHATLFVGVNYQQ